MRLNKFLASCGQGSRRGVEALILEGRVRINGKVCISLSTTVEPSDEVVLDTKRVRPNKPVVVALHKPKGYVCTRDDERDRRTIYELVPAKLRTLAHVGRLDMDSEGLMLLTNQGDLAHQLLHPTKGLEKEYEVTLEKPFDPVLLEKLTKGLYIEEGLAKAERAWLIGHYKLGLVLKQGLKRQIREMLFRVGHEVKRLIRVRIGNLALTGMPEGSWRELKESEVDRLLVHPKAKERPTLSKSRTASARKAMAKEGEKSKEKEKGRDRDKDKAKDKPRSRGDKAGEGAPASRASSGPGRRSSAGPRGGSSAGARGGDSSRKRPARKASRRGGARSGY